MDWTEQVRSGAWSFCGLDGVGLRSEISGAASVLGRLGYT